MRRQLAPLYLACAALSFMACGIMLAIHDYPAAVLLWLMGMACGWLGLALVVELAGEDERRRLLRRPHRRWG